jgi:hypothetical protein
VTTIDTHVERGIAKRKLRTPRSAALAGIVFSVLITLAIVTIQLSLPSNPTEAGSWLTDSGRRDLVLAALALIPFAGIAFLWFVGVIRDRVGDAEDRFFATLFLGSGLLFVAILIAAEATTAGLITAVGAGAKSLSASDAWTNGRYVTRELVEGSLQMAGVFTVATSTILFQTGAGARWLAIAGFGIAALLVVAVFFYIWTALLFPVWVLAVSLDILRVASREAN